MAETRRVVLTDREIETLSREAVGQAPLTKILATISNQMIEALRNEGLEISAATTQRLAVAMTRALGLAFLNHAESMQEDA